MAAIITEREVISEFLEMYKEFTCLWDVSCKQYSNKDARNQALQVLLEKLKVINNEASIATVKKKIENMRAAYKRELKKVQDSKGTGAGLKDVYIPTLWYFEYLTFLDHKETLNRSGVDTLGICGDDEVSETQSLISEPSNPSAIKRRATNFQKKQEKLIECAQQLMSTKDGPAESYGRAIGLQLKDMNRTQQCIAEKLISEVIFFGKMEKLTLQSSIALNSYANSGNHPSASSSPIASSMSNSSDTLNIFPITHETMPISSISTLNEIPNDIQHAYNMQEFLTFKNLQ